MISINLLNHNIQSLFTVPFFVRDHQVHAVARRDKTCPRIQNTSHNPVTLLRIIEKHVPEPKTLPKIKNMSQKPKTLPRIQNTSQNPKCFPESNSVLESGKHFGFLDVILFFWDGFWILASVLGFWEVFCPYEPQ